MQILKEKIKRATNAIVISVFVFLPGALFAQNNDYGLRATANAAQLPGAESGKQLPEIVGLIINALLGVVGTILVVLMIYGGFLWMTAAGDEKQVEKAKEILKNSVIGLVIIFLAYGIASFVISALVNASAA